jgi:hypothetical protein
MKKVCGQFQGLPVNTQFPWGADNTSRHREMMYLFICNEAYEIDVCFPSSRSQLFYRSSSHEPRWL